ncbi:MAG: hypothetical protein FJ009_20890 [Chloroflexi bacterium]|nr:hypothetical protein [Chloroflexota bacterium]
MNDPRLTLSIADWHTTLLLDECDATTRAKIAQRYAAFIVPFDPAALTVRVRSEPGALFIPFEQHGVWQIRTTTDASRGVIQFESHAEKGWMDRAAGRGELVLRAQGNIENYLRVLYAWFALEHNSLLLHSCGILREGKGYVFFGPSGSGKTTTATLSAAHTILSDDLVIIKKIGGTYHACGVPFRGDLPEAPRTNASAELRGIFTLVKDTQHFLAPLALPDAVAKLVRCVPFVMAQPENAQRVTNVCLDLATRVPLRELHFRRDDGFWSVIDQAR